MLAYNELRKGTFISLNDEPWIVEEFEFLRMQKRKPVAKVRIKSLVTGKTQERTFHQSDSVEEVALTKTTVRFLYESRGEFWFDEPGNPKSRFSLSKEEIADAAQFLKQNLEVIALIFNDKIINIEPPVKVDYKVASAPPAIRGNTAQGGNKTVTLENGLEIQVPLFINEGDVIRVNTQLKTYVERVGK